MLHSVFALCSFLFHQKLVIHKRVVTILRLLIALFQMKSYQSAYVSGILTEEKEEKLCKKYVTFILLDTFTFHQSVFICLYVVMLQDFEVTREISFPLGRIVFNFFQQNDDYYYWSLKIISF